MKKLFQSRTIIVVIIGLILNYGLSKIGLTSDQLAETLAGVNGLFLAVVGLLRLDTTKAIDLSNDAGNAVNAAMSTERLVSILGPIIEAILNRKAAAELSKMSQKGNLSDGDTKTDSL